MRGRESPLVLGATYVCGSAHYSDLGPAAKRRLFVASLSVFHSPPRVELWLLRST